MIQTIIVLAVLAILVVAVGLLYRYFGYEDDV